MADPFRTAPPPSGGFGRALRSKRVTTIEAIEDLFYRCDGLRSVTIEEVHGVGQNHGVELARKFKSDRKHLYRRYLMHCLEDQMLSEEENADLEHLRSILYLSPEDVAPIHDEAAREVYGKAVQEALADLDLDSKEEAFLRRLRGELHLSEKEADRLYAEGKQGARDRALSQASARDPGFTNTRRPAGEFTGQSSESIEDAVADAIAKATVAIPALHWFELKQVSGYIADGEPESWHVTVSAGIRPEK